MGMDMLDFVFTAIAVVLCLTVGVAVLPVAAVVLLARWIWRRTHGTTKALGAGTKAPYAYLEEGAPRDSVAHTVAAYEDDPVLGPHATGVLATFESADRRHDAIFSILEEEFGTNSLTWDKFSAPVDVALEGIVRNAVQIANRMQAFDSKEYQRMGRLRQAGAYDPDGVEMARLAVMDETLAEMSSIQAANDRLVAELERLQAQLARMSGAGLDASTDEIASEIARLADETRYYADI